MGKATTPTQFKKGFCARLKAARIVKGLEQAEFAQMLGLLPNTYSKYESRSLLPHHLMEKASNHLGVTIYYLLGIEEPGQGLGHGQEAA